MSKASSIMDLPLYCSQEIDVGICKQNLPAPTTSQELKKLFQTSLNLNQVSYQEALKNYALTGMTLQKEITLKMIRGSDLLPARDNCYENPQIKKIVSKLKPNFQQILPALFGGYKEMNELMVKIKKKKLVNVKFTSKNILLKEKRGRLEKTLFFIGDKEILLKEIDAKIVSNSQKIKINTKILTKLSKKLAKNSLLFEMTPFETHDSIRQIKPSKVYYAILNKVSIGKFSLVVKKALIEQGQIINSGIKKICKTNGKNLFHQKELVEKLFLSLKNYPTILNRFQQSHCNLLQKSQSDDVDKTNVTYLGGGIMLLGAALTPVTGGGSLALAMGLTGLGVVTAIETLDTIKSSENLTFAKSLSTSKMIDPGHVPQSYRELEEGLAWSLLSAVFLGHMGIISAKNIIKLKTIK